MTLPASEPAVPRTAEAHPYILAVDDDPNVLRAVARDLRKRYSDRFRIVTASSGQDALETARQLRDRQDDVALFLADQRMPGMTGVELLEQVLTGFPGSLRVLLTAYADMDATIQAINKARVDYYLTKPWDPPEEQLYPYLDNLLKDWLDARRKPFQGVSVVGHRWSPQSHELRDFLGRYQVPLQWLDVEKQYQDGNGRLVRETLEQQTPLPLVVFEDGTRIVAPSIAQVAEHLGMKTQAGADFYDLVIVGAGPAGLAAGVYGASEGLKTLMVERDAPGGQAGTSSRIENYLGFPDGLTGNDLTRRAVAQARKFHVEILAPMGVVSLRTESDYPIIALSNGKEVRARTVVIATGLNWRRLDVPGIEALQGAGVYYGATLSEAISCVGEDLFVVGGANSAGQGALHFAEYAKHVTMLVRGTTLDDSMSYYLIEQIRKTANITVRTNTEVAAVRGDQRLAGITLKNNVSGETEDVEACSLFIFIGAVPCTDWLQGSVPLDRWGYVLSGPDLSPEQRVPFGDREPGLFETGVPGVFVAGDVRHASVKRVSSAVGEGAVAVQLIHQYMSQGR